MSKDPRWRGIPYLPMLGQYEHQRNLPLVKHQMYEIHNFRVTLKNTGYPWLIQRHQIIIVKINKEKKSRIHPAFPL